MIEDPWTTFRHIVEAVAIFAAGAWAFYTFVYQEKIKPARLPAALSVDISVTRLGRDAHRDIIDVTSSLHNAGLSEIDIAADGVNVWGDRYGTSATHHEHRGDGFRMVGNLIREVRSDVIFSFAELRDASVGGHQGTHIVLEPGDTSKLSYLVVVPRDRYDVVHAQAVAVPIKTPVAARVLVEVVANHDGSMTLRPVGNDLAEDDTDTNFALVP